MSRTGPISQDGYPSSSPPSTDNQHDPFSNSNSQRRYYDNESDNVDYGRRDTYASDSSNPGLNEQNFYDQNGTYDPYPPQDTDSDVDVYGQKYPPSAESISAGQPRMGQPDSSTPTFMDYGAPAGAREAYPAWSSERQIPLSKEEIEDIFLDLTQKFGFQRDSMRNMFDFLMQLLDSRASRMSPNQALLTLHADYIGGHNANYRKWYFAAQLDLDDAIGHVQNPGLTRLKSKRGKDKKQSHEKSLNNALERWRQAMHNMSQYDRLRQIALYLLLWGEAAQVRFVPECLCFIFKCADDYYRSSECQNRVEPVPEGLYLKNVIKPLYRFMRDQGYEVLDGKFVRKEKDHDEIIGYDDVNQLFWYPEGIARIVLTDKVCSCEISISFKVDKIQQARLVDLPPAQRWMKFNQVDWNRAFFKTYYEKRSFGHLLVNFNRIWVIHIAMYYFYTAFNSPTIYQTNPSSPALTWSVTALGGAVATVIMIFATLAEFSYIPTTWNNSSHLTRRLVFLLITLGLTCGPTFYVVIAEHGSSRGGSLAFILGIVQFFISLVATLLFAVMPSGRMFGDRVAGKSRKYLASQTFTASYPSLERLPRIASILLWILVFGCKFTESYFFLTLSFKDPIRVMVHMKVQACNDKFFGNHLCTNQAAFTLTIMYIMDLVLFFLDTFLWYIIWNTVYSIGRSFSLGLSIWTPWKDIYTRLPKRIYAKLLATGDMEVKYKPKVLVSQIWNAIIISMYREHLLSIDHVQKLLYHQVDTGAGGRRSLRAPPFFIAQGDKTYKGEFFPAGSEAERRISFFAQSLTTAIPAPLPVDAMPTFTVLTPHYSEKTLLSLREIIREEDQNTRVTLLEYLKQLHPIEWENFVKDTKILAEESAMFNGPNPFAGDEKGQSKADDLPFYFIGFKSAAPEFTLRTRIWASLRAQTLYRTVSGMMNYSKAIKLLYRVENPEVVQLFGGNTDKLERELERMARRKFKFLVSMQRYSKFNKEEHENAEFLLRAYPDLQIAYLEEEPPRKEGGDPRIFSSLIDGHSEFVPETGRRRPKFRIELPGNPILGDGKSDNQNHAIIFYRGEYLQLIDANQDNYLEECLKIRNILGEFEEYAVSTQSPYAQWGHKDFKKPPVAIVGAREYIFSENIGILGDLAAGKEQTFGTLAARSMAWIGGKLHYGHPDFLNGLYMSTRGGVSKAQKGLHLNEDIYAGMNAFGRGARIKHTEYYQCGKGRDLGFGTILNFQTKIGTGMGEQMLSREYYYLGTQLPIDRFLTFYYGHPGFHINNMLVILSVQIFIVTLVFLGTLNSQLVICKFTDQGAFLGQPGCYNLVPVFDWIRRCIISIFLVFMISFLPLFLQELVERGTVKAVIRLAKQFGSLSPVFEIFSTQIYTHSILSNLTLGGAREFLRWMCRGNSRSHNNSWIGYCRLSRTMITGYKKKRLGHPSEKLSGDVPRAGWRAVLFSEVIFPVFMAVLFVIAYMFVKSFPGSNGKQPPSPLIRIAVISLGPIVWNAAVLLTLFIFSLFLGPMLEATLPNFGTMMAFIAHVLGAIGMIGFFEFLWFLELWDVSHAVLGLIAVIAIQRAIHKILIAVFLSREFKHDETNRAWWSGRWYGRGLGTHVMSQPPREFLVKIIELSLWSSDLLLGHLLLFMLTPPILIPYFDRFHATILCESDANLN
ncbi:1,3-beta-D-glucan synthase [Termitomyces sp. T159_Od127]|nr:1,3-beta-D-glucan synthase [Termitomyces sp. T159_Od127]